MAESWASRTRRVCWAGCTLLSEPNGCGQAGLPAQAQAGCQPPTQGHVNRCRLLVSLFSTGTHARHHVKVVCNRRAFRGYGAFPGVSGGRTRGNSPWPCVLNAKSAAFLDPMSQGRMGPVRTEIVQVGVAPRHAPLRARHNTGVWLSFAYQLGDN